MPQLSSLFHRDFVGYSQTFGLICKKTVNLFHSTIENRDDKFMICRIQYQILAHYGQADKAEISSRVDPRWSADINAGKTGAVVSPLI